MAGLGAVTEAVSGCRWLLVLDNCEHVLELARGACDQLAGRAADLRILVTSRIPLDIEPECLWRVQPMALPGEAGHPVATEAVRLFYARAAMAGVRQYAAARLADAGEEDLARWRHARASSTRSRPTPGPELLTVKFLGPARETVLDCYVGDLYDGQRMRPEKLAAWQALRERYGDRDESRVHHGALLAPAA